LNACPVCPIYLWGHSVHCSWYTPTSLCCNIISVLTLWEVYVLDILILYFYICDL
jgi:hypothetical protein